MQIGTVRLCRGGQLQVSTSCANCSWWASRLMDASDLARLHREARRDRRSIASDMRLLARANSPQLLVDLADSA